MVEWKLSKRQSACLACSRVFEDGEAHISSLTLRGEELSREDACLPCWRKRDEREALFWWRTRHSIGKRRGLALNLEALEALFVRLEGHEAVALLELRYVLCLILMRKRRLRIERVEREGDRESLIVARPRQETRFAVAVFDFGADKIEELRGRLQEVFEGAEGDAPGIESALSPATDDPPRGS